MGVFIHRTDVSLLWAEESDEEWENTIRSTRFTMYPVCEGSIDNVVGILDTKDYFRLDDKSRKNVLEKAVRAPYFVPEGAKADITFRNMKKNRASFAVVLDEYAGFSGIISIKDLIERIVGDIEEDHDAQSREDELIRVDERTWRIRGNVSLAVMEKEMEIDLPDDYDTFNGLVLGLYGSIPEEGSRFSVEYEGIEIQVSDVQEHQVAAAVVILPEKQNEDVEEDD